MALPGSDRMTRATRLVIAAAQENAFRRKSRIVDLTDLIFALLTDRDTVAYHVLIKCGFDIDSALAALQVLSARVEHEQGESEEDKRAGFSYRVSQLLQLAVECADECGDRAIGPEYILLALVRYDEPEAKSLFTKSVSTADILEVLRSLEPSSLVAKYDPEAAFTLQISAEESWQSEVKAC